MKINKCLRIDNIWYDLFNRFLERLNGCVFLVLGAHGAI